LAATVGRVRGVGVVDVVVVVVDVPTPIRRPLDEVVLLAAAAAGTVVVVVTGRVLVAVVAGRVRVDVVTGRGLVAGSTPATGGTLNRFKAASTLIG